jgi:hypothetical protein
MNSPIKVYKKGRVQLAIWQGEFDGKVTYSYSVKKNYFDQKTQSWKDSVYFSMTDLADVSFLIQTVITNSINKNSEKKEVSQNVQNVKQVFQNNDNNVFLKDSPDEIPW